MLAGSEGCGTGGPQPVSIDAATRKTLRSMVSQRLRQDSRVGQGETRMRSTAVVESGRARGQRLGHAVGDVEALRGEQLVESVEELRQVCGKARPIAVGA